MNMNMEVTLMRGNITNVDLVDIRDVTVDKNLPQRERLVEYVRQIGNPYRFKCGPYTFTAIYPDNGKSIEDCLRGTVT